MNLQTIPHHAYLFIPLVSMYSVDDHRMHACERPRTIGSGLCPTRRARLQMRRSRSRPPRKSKRRPRPNSTRWIATRKNNTCDGSWTSGMSCTMDSNPSHGWPASCRQLTRYVMVVVIAVVAVLVVVVFIRAVVVVVARRFCYFHSCVHMFYRCCKLSRWTNVD